MIGHLGFQFELTKALAEKMEENMPAEIQFVNKELMAKIADEVVLEVFRASSKHGEHAMAGQAPTVGDRLGILGEEFGEVCRATTYDNGSRENLREELVQTAAMAVAWVYALDSQAKAQEFLNLIGEGAAFIQNGVKVNEVGRNISKEIGLGD